MSTNLGTKVNRRERAVRVNPNIIENVSVEWSDKGDGVVVKISDTREEAEEVPFYKFFQWYPKFLAAVVNDLVLVRVTVNSVSAGRSSKEVRKKVN